MLNAVNNFYVLHPKVMELDSDYAIKVGSNIFSITFKHLGLKFRKILDY